MKIAFLGKGGSGKSTMATAFVKYFHANCFNVLAIDADHNIDLSYNLGIEPSLFLGNDPEYIKEYVGSAKNDSYKQARVVAESNDTKFTLSPFDSYTLQVSTEVEKGLRLITAGPHTDRVRTQESCSHSLAAPLKIYLPFLLLKEKEIIIIDERAGTDPVATGILSGVDVALIVREPTVQSSRVADQIKKELDLTGIKYLIIDNKKDGVERDTERAISMLLEYTASL